MKKNRLYRIGAGLLAGLLVFTGVPQNISFAQEAANPDENAVSMEIQTDNLSDGEDNSRADSIMPSADLSADINTDIQKDGSAQGDAAQSAEAGDAPDDELQAIDPQEDPTPPPVKHVTGIKLNLDKLTLMRNDTAQLVYTLEPADATEDSEKVVKFTSSNEEIATVTQTGGLVLGQKKGGPVFITAETGNGLKATCEVTVIPIPVDTVTISPEETLKLTEGGAAGTLTVSILPEDADERGLRVTSTDEKVATVTSQYNDTTKKYELTVTPVSGGVAMIKAVSLDDSNRKAYAVRTVEVEAKPVEIEEIAPKRAEVSMYQNQTMTLGVLYKPAHTTQTGVTWEVVSGHTWDYNGDGTEEECVTVDEKGLVRCLYPLPAAVEKKDVTIKAASIVKPSLTTTVKVTIKKPNIPASSLTVLTKELTLEDGGGAPGIVEVRVEPTATTDTEVTATIDDGTVAGFLTAAGGATPVATAKAVIDNKGTAKFTVKGQKPGSCDITFQVGTGKGILTTSLPVTVNEYVAPVDSLKMDSLLEITEQAEGELEAEIKPLEAENKYIDWSVSNPEIATIKGLNATGGRTTAQKTGTAPDEKLTSTVKIEAHMIGECIITATAAGGKSQTCKVKVKPGSTPVTGLTVETAADSGLGNDPETIYIRQGQSIVLTPKVTPSGANPKVRWSGSTNVASVTVDENSVCTVKAERTGECVVTAQASGTDSACKKKIKIIVKKPRLEVESPEDFSFDPDMLPITEETLKNQLKVKFYAYEKPALTESAVELEAKAYRLQVVAEDGTSLRPYAPEDLEKAGTKILVISYDYEKERIECPNHIPVTMKEFSEAVLVSVTPLSGEESDIWNVPNGTPALSLPLAKTTEITVKGIKSQKTVRVDAEIEWNLSAANYNPNLETAQEFVVYGTVKLPAYVKKSVSENDISLDVSARVHVREKATSGKQVEAPRFSVLGGEKIGNTAVEVPYGSKIVIESATEEAVIYYVLDRRPDADRKIPQDEEHRYKSPLEMTAMTTTIYAIAVKEGYTDSNCSECTIKLIQAEPGIPEDPDDPEPDQVTDEDRPSNGKIPSGLWVAVQPDEQGRKNGFPYTGSAIKPVIHVYDHTTLLQEKKDYTITYKNNTKAGEEGSANAPSIIVKGKGNYSGQTSVSFTIKPQSIEDEEAVVMEEYAAVKYNKKEQKPNPSLIWKGKKLTKGKDYTVTDGTYKDPKTYDVTVTGIGNFTGTRKMTYEIFNGGVAVSKLKVSKIPDQKCTGEAITPSVVVKYKNTVLREGANYTVQYKNNIEVGTASVVITGRGGYKGTRRVDFKIKAMAKISEAGFTMTFDPATPVYNGAPVKPVSYKAVYQGKELKEGVDYKVSYTNNNKAGTASLILTGMGRFNGTAKKTFKIQAGDLSKNMIVELAASYPYEKGGCKPKPRVFSGNYVLQEGKDYTLSYSSHKAVGNNAVVTIKGKGSFKGKITKQFAVTRQDIGNLRVVAADKTFRNKANSYRTSVKVFDVNGKALTAGNDYDKEMYYTYADGPRQGEQVLPTDLIPRGTTLRVEVRVTNPKNYVGTAYGVYRIVQADISKAKVKVDAQEYTGRKRKPGKDQIHVTLNGTILGKSDYEIVGYENNVNQGTAKVTIKGIGSYGGTKTASFKIRKRGLFNLSF